jgi:hypothetical protein
MVVPSIPAFWRWRQEDHEFKASLGYIVSETLSQKTSWGYSSAVECLLSRHKALGSIPRTVG